MSRLALFLLLTPLLATRCLAQQFPVTPGGELPVAAIELDKMPWTRILGIGPAQEFATIVREPREARTLHPTGPVAASRHPQGLFASR
jgi:hypothetical protein